MSPPGLTWGQWIESRPERYSISWDIITWFYWPKHKSPFLWTLFITKSSWISWEGLCLSQHYSQIILCDLQMAHLRAGRLHLSSSTMQARTSRLSDLQRHSHWQGARRLPCTTKDVESSRSWTLTSSCLHVGSSWPHGACCSPRSLPWTDWYLDSVLSLTWLFLLYASLGLNSRVFKILFIFIFYLLPYLSLEYRAFTHVPMINILPLPTAGGCS